MRVLFMGTPDFAVSSLEYLVKANYEVIGVVTQPDRQKGRGKKITAPPVKQKALELGLPIFQPEKVRNEEFIEILKELNPDIIVVVAFGQILPKDILELPSFGCINVHASLLPKYRGAAPIHWSIINGETKTGITTMYMNEGLDTGDMLLKEEILIDNNMNSGELHDELAELGGELLVRTLDLLQKNKIIPQPQNDQESTYASLLKKEHEVISWDENSTNIHNLVRGMNPWPGAYTVCNNERLKILETRLNNLESSGDKSKVGTIIEVDNDGFWVKTEDDKLLITKVQPAGKKAMLAKDFINGYKIKTGLVLGDQGV
ncbi:methionyl-tRNA formyltransferase [Desulfonispora thiosulfatigenes DSM 11270]|uniref:Methionyl-tRNA formyltransferase n=1 Tax=Desulfonispora thiosulfatigenes DSM 11270 TaxID=656914 RepID=A0A1W1VJ44_DESTI|nr:methionyl-tRNA formyltransferase [Desulfonispora thiosulfatigenes]SMB93399.1 methionyl-tRNA formyltransferase [Desulfonispora thiosulfatigenes DSM 11270]